jgi:hypothetical protein
MRAHSCCSTPPWQQLLLLQPPAKLRCCPGKLRLCRKPKSSKIHIPSLNMMRRTAATLSSKIGNAATAGGSAASRASRWRPHQAKPEVSKGALEDVLAAAPSVPKPRFTIGRDQLHFALYIVPAGLLYFFYVKDHEQSPEEKHKLLEDRYGNLVQHSKARRDAFDRCVCDHAVSYS